MFKELLSFTAFAALVVVFFVSIANAATILFPTGGGTGIGTIPTFGQMLVGNANGTYTLTATSSLGITSGGSGSAFPTSTNPLIATYFVATSSTATSTFNGKIVIGGTAANTILAGGVTAADFPNAFSIFTQSRAAPASGAAFSSHNIGVLGEAVASGGSQGRGVYGVGQGAGVTTGIGVYGTATSSATNDSGPLTGVVGSITTVPHPNGTVIGVQGEASGGVLNYSFYSLNGNIFNAGKVGIGTTSPYSMLSVVGTATAAVFESTTTATSTFGGGINIATGCFAINGACVGGSGGGGTVNSVALTVPTFLSVSGSPVTTSGTLAVTLSGIALPVANGGTGTTTPYGVLSGGGAAIFSTPTTSVTCSGLASCTDFTAIGTSPITITGSGDGTFSTTSANWWATFGLAFSTTSTNFWATNGLAFSTTSANNWYTNIGHISTTTAGTAGQIAAWSGNSSLYSLSTTTASCAGTDSCTTFTVIGSSPVTITGSGSGSSFSTTSATYWLTQVGIVATSASETKGQLSYWTSTAGSPAALASIATTSISCSGNILCTSFTAIGSSPITISSTDLQWSTSSADWYRTLNPFSTTSANAWIYGSTTLGFSTTSADWYRTLNPFSTTSANALLYATTTLGFSTTSANNWIYGSTTLGWSTTSADWYRSLNPAPFSTTSANAWSTFGLGWATSSADWYRTLNPFSTTSANALLYATTTLGFSTTSADWYRTLNPFSTTSANALLFATTTLGFSTTSANNWIYGSTTLGWSTTSANVYHAGTTTLGFSTTSANNWIYGSTTLGFSTTSSDWYRTLNPFSTTSANAWSTFGLGFSTSSSNNWFTNIGHITTSTAGSAGQLAAWSGTSSLYPVATTTVSCAGTDSCTAFTIIGSSPITITGSGSGGGTYPFTPSTDGAINTSATSTPIQGTNPGLGLDVSNTSWYGIGGQLLAYASSTNQSTIFGLQAGGVNATTSATMNGNTIIGFLAFSAGGTSVNNTAIGNLALNNAGASGRNVAVGSYALASSTTGVNNVAMGWSAGKKLTSGAGNVFIGDDNASRNQVTGTANMFLGPSVGQQLTSGNNNTAIGNASLQSITTGQFNLGLGYRTGVNITTGSNNIQIGQVPGGGNNITTGDDNILIGNNVQATGTTPSLYLNIANFLFGFIPATNTATVLNYPQSGSFSIGSTSPTAKFAIHTNNGDTATALFAIGSSTASATSTLFLVDNTGSTTIANGVNITGGCFAKNGTCLATGGTVTAIGVTANQGVSGSSSGGATPNLTLTLGALTSVTSLNGLVVTANTGVITTGTWNGSIITETYGGTNAASIGANMLVANNGASTLVSTSSPTAAAYFATSTTATSTFAGVMGIGTTSTFGLWGALVIQSSTTVGTSTGSILVTANRLSTSTSMMITYNGGNTQVINVGGSATTITLNAATWYPGGRTVLQICSPPDKNPGSISIVSSAQIDWVSAYTPVSTANKCDLLSILGILSTSSQSMYPLNTSYMGTTTLVISATNIP